MDKDKGRAVAPEAGTVQSLQTCSNLFSLQTVPASGATDAQKRYAGRVTNSHERLKDAFEDLRATHIDER